MITLIYVCMYLLRDMLIVMCIYLIQIHTFLLFNVLKREVSNVFLYIWTINYSYSYFYDATKTGFMCYVDLVYFLLREATTLPILALYMYTYMLSWSCLFVSSERQQRYQDLPRLLCSLELSWSCEENT